MSTPLDTLLGRLVVGKPRVRRAAARHLSKNTHKDSHAALSRALTDPDPIVRKFAARAIGKISDIAAPPELFVLLRDPFAVVRTAAAASMPRTPAAKSALEVAVAKEKDAHVRQVMLGAIERASKKPQPRRRTRKAPHARLRDLSFGPYWQEDQSAASAPAVEAAETPPTTYATSPIHAAVMGAIARLGTATVGERLGQHDARLATATVGERLLAEPSAISAAELAAPPPDDPAAILRALALAPIAELERAMASMHPAWAPVMLLHRARRGLRDVAPLAGGSSLVAFMLHQTAKARPTAQLYPLLSAGGGTTARQAYPAFTLVTRPTISIVPPPIHDRMKELAARIFALHEMLMLAAPMLSIMFHTGAVSFSLLYAEQQQRVFSTIDRHARAYAYLRAGPLADRSIRIRRRHVQDVLESGVELPAIADVDRKKEGLVNALLGHIHEKWTGDPLIDMRLKEASIELLRSIALTYHFTPPAADDPNAQEGGAHHLADHLIQRTVHAPLELARELALGHEQHFPRLTGGRASNWEVEWAKLLREVLGRNVAAGTKIEPRVFSCRPLTKLAAIQRGVLGGDCSSANVPLRALSPHHAYYGIYGVDQLRGYMTVFEAWAVRESGERVPALCLETINVPIDAFASVQQDLLMIFEAIAKSRGLLPHLVLVREAGTFNYENGALLAGCPRARLGEKVKVEPADPVVWALYDEVTDEAEYYSPFNAGDHVILAPFDAARDRVQPENVAEAARLASLVPEGLVPTVKVGEEIKGFISALPTTNEPAC